MVPAALLANLLKELSMNYDLVGFGWWVERSESGIRPKYTLIEWEEIVLWWLLPYWQIY